MGSIGQETLSSEFQAIGDFQLSDEKRQELSTKLERLKRYRTREVMMESRINNA